MSEERCGGHEALAEELRAHAAGVLNLLEPWINQVREAPPAPGETPVTCASCPLCAIMALLRGERSEMAVRLAEQAAGLLTVLRAALAEGNGPAWGAARGDTGAHESRTNDDGAHATGAQANGASGDGARGDGARGDGTSDSRTNVARPAADESRDVQRIPVSRVDGGTASGHC